MRLLKNPPAYRQALNRAGTGQAGICFTSPPVPSCNGSGFSLIMAQTLQPQTRQTCCSRLMEASSKAIRAILGHFRENALQEILFYILM
jgi:hypothetical protein